MLIFIFTRKNEELIQLINKSETDMNELTDENECLREQLGMDPKKPVDIKEFQSKISSKREEQRALNIVLQKEVTKKYIRNNYIGLMEI